jgi:hypothetical protein
MDTLNVNDEDQADIDQRKRDVQRRKGINSCSFTYETYSFFYRTRTFQTANTSCSTKLTSSE